MIPPPPPAETLAGEAARASGDGAVGAGQPLGAPPLLPAQEALALALAAAAAAAAVILAVAASRRVRLPLAARAQLSTGGESGASGPGLGGYEYPGLRAALRRVYVFVVGMLSEAGHPAAPGLTMREALGEAARRGLIGPGEASRLSRLYDDYMYWLEPDEAVVGEAWRLARGGRG